MFLALKNALGKPLVATYKGLLDSFSGASAAYSLRRLSGSYTGHALRVRRSTDNVEVDVGFNGGSVSSTSPITNVDDEPSSTVLYSDSSWQFTGSAFSGPNSANTGAFDFGGNTSTLTCSLDFSSTVVAGSNLSVSFTVNSITNSGVLVILPSGGGSPIASQTIDSTGAKTIAFSNLSSAAVEVQFSFPTTSSSINVSSFSISQSAGDTAATTLGAFIAEASSPDLFVDTWYDQTGNGRHGVQLTAANQPSLAISGTLRDNLFFDGSNDSLSVNSTVSTSIPFGDGTVAAVHKSELAGRKSSYIYNGAVNNSPRHLIGSNSAGNFLIYRGFSAAGSQQDTNLNNYIGIFDNSSGVVRVGQLYVRGSLVASTTTMTTTAFDSDTMSIGGYGQLHDNLYELILWSDPDVGNNNRTAIDADVETYYGIS